MKITRFRDQPEKMSDKLKNDFMQGPSEAIQTIKNHYSSYQHLETAKSSPTRPISISSEIERYVRPYESQMSFYLGGTSERTESKVLKDRGEVLLETVNSISQALERSSFRSVERPRTAFFG